MTEVDVGDIKTLRVAGQDGSGGDMPVAEAEVVVTAPSGQEATYTTADMTRSGDEEELFLRLEFTEAGFWHIRMEVENAGGRDVETRWAWAREKAAADLAFFGPSEWPGRLPEQVMEEGPRRLMQLARRAERLIVRRYQETDARGQSNLILDEYYGRDIRLDGYVEQEEAERIDLGKSDPRLVEAMREAAARVVEFYARRPEESEYVERKDQGERRVDYRDKDLPSSAFAPLRPFDERDSWF